MILARILVLKLDSNGEMTGVFYFGFAAACVDNNLKGLNWHGILQCSINA